MNPINQALHDYVFAAPVRGMDEDVLAFDIYGFLKAAKIVIDEAMGQGSAAANPDLLGQCVVAMATVHHADRLTQNMEMIAKAILASSVNIERQAAGEHD